MSKLNKSKSTGKSGVLNFKKARDEAKKLGGFTEIPDGNYVVKLVSIKRGESKASGRPQVSAQFLILDGDHAGSKVYKHMGMDSEDSLKYVLKDLDRLGVDIDEIEDNDDLDKALAALEKSKPVGKISLTTKGEYQNLYVNKIYDADEVEELDLGGDATDDDDTDTDTDDKDEDLEMEDEDDAGDDDEEDEDAGDDDEEDEDAGDDDEEDEDEAAEDAPSYKKGDKIKAKLDGEWYTGTVLSIKKDGDLKVEFEDGDVLDIEPDNDVRIVESNDDEGEDKEETRSPAKGDTVSFKSGKKSVEGKVVKVNKDGTFNVKSTDGKSYENVKDDDSVEIQD